MGFFQPHGGYRRRDGAADLIDRARKGQVAGRLLGIARHGRPRGPMETVDDVAVTPAQGIQGDFRGSLKPGRNRRQVTMMAASAWRDVLDELGVSIPWEQRRVNLLADGLDLFDTRNARIVCEGGPVFLVTGECDPCSRMEEVAPGLKAALTPRWRGGVTMTVIEGGRLRPGTWMRIER